MRPFFLFGVFSLTLFCSAQDGPVPALARPSLGFVLDGGRGSVRPVHGIPGAAIVGDQLDFGFAAGSIAVSPRQDFLLAAPKDDADPRLRLVHLRNGAADVTPLDNAIASPGLMLLSPSGNIAVLSTGARFQILSGLPSNPAVREVPPQGSGSPLAVSDTGMTLLAAENSDSSPVWLSSGGGAVVSSLPGSIAAAAFRPSGTDAVALTRTGDLFYIHDPMGNGEARLIRAGDEQTSDPVAVRLSADSTRAFSVNQRGTVAIIDLQTGAISTASCDCVPTGLQPLNLPALFRVNEISRRPLLLFDGSASEPRIWFVPPAGDVQESIQ